MICQVSRSLLKNVHRENSSSFCPQVSVNIPVVWQFCQDKFNQHSCEGNFLLGTYQNCKHALLGKIVIERGSHQINGQVVPPSVQFFGFPFVKLAVVLFLV